MFKNFVRAQGMKVLAAVIRLRVDKTGDITSLVAAGGAAIGFGVAAAPVLDRYSKGLVQKQKNKDALSRNNGLSDEETAKITATIKDALGDNGAFNNGENGVTAGDRRIPSQHLKAEAPKGVQQSGASLPPPSKSAGAAK